MVTSRDAAHTFRTPNDEVHIMTLRLSLPFASNSVTSFPFPLDPDRWLGREGSWALFLTSHSSLLGVQRSAYSGVTRVRPLPRASALTEQPSQRLWLRVDAFRPSLTGASGSVGHPSLALALALARLHQV